MLIEASHIAYSNLLLIKQISVKPGSRTQTHTGTTVSTLFVLLQLGVEITAALAHGVLGRVRRDPRPDLLWRGLPDCGFGRWMSCSWRHMAIFCEQIAGWSRFRWLDAQAVVYGRAPEFMNLHLYVRVDNKFQGLQLSHASGTVSVCILHLCFYFYFYCIECIQFMHSSKISHQAQWSTVK